MLEELEEQKKIILEGYTDERCNVTEADDLNRYLSRSKPSHIYSKADGSAEVFCEDAVKNCITKAEV